jgi:hypothetical protein
MKIESLASRLSFLAFFVLSLALLPHPVAATSYQMMSDPSLADQSRVIAQVRVVQASPAVLGEGEPATDYQVDVERVVKGALPGSTVVVRVPGGVRPDGFGLKIWGAPEFQSGEQALLFLSPAKDGTYRIVHLMLGAFHRRAAGSEGLALRDLSQAAQVVPEGQKAAVEETRRFDKFADWLADRAAGLERARDYVLQPGTNGLGQSVAPFTTMDGDDNIPIRWFTFDNGGSVSWRVHDGGQPGLGTDATAAVFRTGLQTWNDDPGSNVRYNYVGLTNANAGLTRDDGINAILFNDPNGDEADGTFDCSEGGVIAVGGPFFYESTRTYQGKAYHEAAEADIVTNDGTQCLFQDNPSAAQEVFAHELGHTLGLGHSTNKDALMYAFVHDDGRGARLSADDRAGIDSLYPSSDGGGGGGNPLPSGPAAPTNLKATPRSGTEALLSWTDNSSNETGFRIERATGSGSFQQVGTAAANATGALVSGLTPGTAYTFRVFSVRSGTLSSASNTVKITTPAASALDCGGGPALCLADNRFRVEVDWRNQHSNNTMGKGMLTRVSDKTGTVWFFDPTAVDLIVKVLDGRAVNNRFWVFAGSLTDVEFWLKITDTQTGAVRVYHNRPGDTRGLADTSAFAASGATAAPALVPLQELRSVTPTASTPTQEVSAAVSPSACATGANALCLGGRFQVEVTWRNPGDGSTGVGGAIPSTANTGSFWFFSQENAELVVKILDGRPVNGKFWVFYGALTDVDYRVKVTDTQTGTVKVYHSKPGSLSALADTAAF